MTKPRARDVQRSRVYAFENAYVMPSRWWQNPTMTLDEVRALHADAMALYGRRPLHIVPGRGGGAACFAFHITFGHGSRHPATVLHETAHALAPGERHGPVFVRIYLDLLDRYGVPGDTAGRPRLRYLRNGCTEKHVAIASVEEAERRVRALPGYRVMRLPERWLTTPLAPEPKKPLAKRAYRGYTIIGDSRSQYRALQPNGLFSPLGRYHRLCDLKERIDRAITQDACAHTYVRRPGAPGERGWHKCSSCEHLKNMTMVRWPAATSAPA